MDLMPEEENIADLLEAFPQELNEVMDTIPQNLAQFEPIIDEWIASNIPENPATEAVRNDAAKYEVILIKCGDNKAELYPHKFGSGIRGRCIKFEQEWYTPVQFERISGRAASRSWKRSIKCKDRRLASLIKAGKLVPHCKFCLCSVCMEGGCRQRQRWVVGKPK